MNRIIIFEKDGKTLVQAERLQKQPSGNGDQRRKQIRNGWQPSFVATGRPYPYENLGTRGLATESKFVGLDSGYGEIEILPRLGMLVQAEEIDRGILAARWAEAVQAENTEENLAAEAAVFNRHFCLESGLVSALEDDTAPELSKTVSDALDILTGRVAAHTCAEFPNLKCANPYCDHEPVSP